MWTHGPDLQGCQNTRTGKSQQDLVEPPKTKVVKSYGGKFALPKKKQVKKKTQMFWDDGECLGWYFGVFW